MDRCSRYRSFRQARAAGKFGKTSCFRGGGAGMGRNCDVGLSPARQTSSHQCDALSHWCDRASHSWDRSSHRWDRRSHSCEEPSHWCETTSHLWDVSSHECDHRRPILGLERRPRPRIGRFRFTNQRFPSLVTEIPVVRPSLRRNITRTVFTSFRECVLNPPARSAAAISEELFGVSAVER